MLLVGSALSAPSLACAQTQSPAPAAPAAEQARPSEPAQEAAPEVSAPGDIVVVGQHLNVSRDTPQVVSLLSTADIARTGEGNIAGALGRVTGLSVVGSGFVYVRGLGDRYSLALLNGSPLPSPEPLRRVVPLDLFPTNIVSSSLVQKSYSPNYPGEFGGGVINLTTTAVPKESFLTASTGIGASLRTTGHLGYVYAGGGRDWTGFDDGTRDYPPALAAFFSSGDRLSAGINSKPIAKQLINGENALVQKQDHIGPNWSASLSGGTAWELGDDVRLGLIATAGYSNKWQTRDSTQQASLNADLSDLEQDFQRVSTDNRVVANALAGLGLEFGRNKIRWTNLFIHDTLKHTRLGVGKRHGNTTTDFMQQDTAWYERQLFDTQLVAEFKLDSRWSLDLRGGYARSKREAPNEITLEYVRTNASADPFGAYFLNRLNNGNGGDATVSYSRLKETLWSGGADLTFRWTPDLAFSAGYAYYNSDRDSSRRDFQFQASPAPDRTAAFSGVAMLRPDLLLGSANIDYFNINLIETNEGNPAFNARLLNHAGYGRLNWQITPQLSIDAGVRYETAKEIVTPIQVFTVPGASATATNLNNHYWLPAATITWQLNPEMQFRVNASKTIARPQFRELLPQPYFDPDTNRSYTGNPLLQDGKLTNAEVRYEWYFATGQRFSIAGFYKRIDKPIETYITGDSFITSFANAPSADLYGGEVELQKRFGLGDWFSGNFFANRDLLLLGNYSYTKSKLKVGAGDTVRVYGASGVALATDYFRNGASLTGQSDHLVNLQFGLEDREHLSQQTFILSYASKRVTSRGLANGGQPDVYEYPGLTLDFVVRQGLKVVGRQFDLKFEARNITDHTYRETQSNGTNTVTYNRYRDGASFTLSVSTTF